MRLATLILAASAVLAGHASQAAPMCGTQLADLLKEQLAKCGGKTYSKCDDEKGDSQETLYRLAESGAIAEEKLLLVEIGADWCSWCTMINRDLANKPELAARIDEHFVRVKLNGELSSTQRLTARLKFNYWGFPSAAVIDPVSRKILNPRAYSAMAGGLEGIVEDLEKTALKIKPPKPGKNEEKLIGGVRLSLLERPVEKNLVFGETTYEPSTRLKGSQKTEFVRLMRKGILYLHAFHWVNAVRSFNSALKLEKSPIALALRAIALLEIERAPSTESVKSAKEAAAIKADWLDKDDRAMIKYALNLTCSRQTDACGKKSLMLSDTQSIACDIIRDHTFKKTDYVAYMAYKSRYLYDFSPALEQQPRHAGANHYLTHIHETDGKIKEAEERARIYAEEAKDSAHALHMYGHILPQIGKWNDAVDYFKKAQQLHYEEFAAEGMLPKEDWHFSHNTDLLAASLVYLDRVQEAQEVVSKACDQGFEVSCHFRVGFEILNGRGDVAERLLLQSYKGFLANTFYANLRFMAALGRGDKAAVDAMVAGFKKDESWEDKSLFYGRVAYEILHNGASPELVEKMLVGVQGLLKKPGFDSWSFGVIQSRALARILSDNGRADLSARLKSMAVSAFEGSVCKTEACKVR